MTRYVYFVDRSDPSYPALEILSKMYKKEIIHAFSISGDIDGVVISSIDLPDENLVFYDKMKLVESYGEYYNKDFLFCLVSENGLNDASNIKKILRENSKYFEVYCNNKTLIIFSPKDREALDKISELIFRVLGKHTIYVVFRDFASD